MFLIILSSISLGIILTLAVQIFLIKKLYQDLPEVEKPFIPQFSPFKLPQELIDAIKTPDAEKKKESCVCLNLLFQFLFRELKDTKLVREWVIKKLTVEFDEMMASTPGKLLDNITLRDFNLGSTFPIVRNVSVKNVQLRADESAIEEVDMLVDLVYNGGFQLAVDLDLVFNKSAYLCVKITKLRGPVRLRFSRIPYTHWCFSFIQDPQIEFKVESHFGTRQIPQITSLIINQIRRTLRKKHTLPNYKIRYKPFFTKLPPVTRDISGTTVGLGQLKVTSVECSRLLQPAQDSQLFCTLAVDQEAWVELSSVRRKLWITHEFDVSFTENQAIGMIFRTEFLVDRYDEVTMVETVIPSSPADLAGIKKNDLIVSIGGTKVTSTRMAAKLIKAAKEKFTLRIERVSPLTNKRKQTKSESEPPKEVSGDVAVKASIPEQVDNNNAQPNSTQAELITEASTSEPVPSVSEIKPTNTGEDIKLGRFQFISSKVKMFQRKKTAENDEMASGSHSLNASPVVRRRSIGNKDELPSVTNPKQHVRRRSADGRILTDQQVDELGQEAEQSESRATLIPKTDHNSILDMKKTKLVKSCDFPTWRDAIGFELKEGQKFLNIGVWSRVPEEVDKQKRVVKHQKDVLLGHASIPLMDIALDCLTTKQGDTQMTLNLCPPKQSPSISKTKYTHLQTHSGFDSSLCFGDITLAILHTPKNDIPVINLESVPSDSDTEHSDEENTYARSELNESKHDFVATNFTAVTYCNFCSKKIWLKVAFQCKACAMICHKKCTEKCQEQTHCSKDASTTKLLHQQTFDSKQTNKKTSLPAAILNRFGRRGRDKQRTQTETLTTHHPEITCEPPTPDEETKPFHRPRSNSAPRNRLAMDSGDDMPRTQSSSTIDQLRHKRAGSVGHERGWESDSSSDDEINLMQFLKDQQKSQQADEIVVTAAKEMGKELFAHLEPEQRREKLDAMVSKFQLEIDEESEKRAELTRLEREAPTLEKKRQIQAKVKNSDEKIQALALLMLHYCAGLQDCLDKMEEEKQRSGREEPWVFMDVNEASPMVESLDNDSDFNRNNNSNGAKESKSSLNDVSGLRKRTVDQAESRKRGKASLESEEQIEQWVADQLRSDTPES